MDSTVISALITGGATIIAAIIGIKVVTHSNEKKQKKSTPARSSALQKSTLDLQDRIVFIPLSDSVGSQIPHLEDYELQLRHRKQWNISKRTFEKGSLPVYLISVYKKDFFKLYKINGFKEVKNSNNNKRYLSEFSLLEVEENEKDYIFGELKNGKSKDLGHAPTFNNLQTATIKTVYDVKQMLA